jgi:hypothetical protein
VGDDRIFDPDAWSDPQSHRNPESFGSSLRKPNRRSLFFLVPLLVVGAAAVGWVYTRPSGALKEWHEEGDRLRADHASQLTKFEEVRKIEMNKVRDRWLVKNLLSRENMAASQVELKAFEDEFARLKIDVMKRQKMEIDRWNDAKPTN